MKPSSTKPSEPAARPARKPERQAAETDLKREQMARQNDRNTSADDLGRSPRSNKLSGSGIDVAGPGGK
ncbi:hypothetical protein N5K27_10105 [Pigmentiphaga sp. GD03639]|uniref:Uncharacterized protein n=1 Tax=Pigmentiphaga daeguensis TaxID=414049 RepID=A0ABN1C7U2_9BURK|nr:MULTISPECIES: hypothetical protein [unclassified Pigmentiphaga]MDH2236650.1 hypothetical protein [Pigmentiphaga sp. GD03639]OVZ61900.1 hypothetical protein CDO46_18540 [Pigmentiphaga sp. NML030171]